MEGYDKRYTFWEGFARAMSFMNDAQELEFRRAIDDFCFNGSLPKFEDSVLSVAWQLVIPTLEKSIKLSESGRKGRKVRKENTLISPLISPLITEEEVEEEIEKEKEKEICACGGRISHSTATGKRRCENCGEVY